MALTSQLTQKIFDLCQPLNEGQVATYIPELSKVDPKLWAVSVTSVDGTTWSHGDHQTLFSLQSASKPFAYGLALQLLGKDRIMEKVGVEPTGEAFNSIIELEKQSHRPFNPMINSGAIAICNLLLDHQENSGSHLLIDLIESMTGAKTSVNQSIFESEKNTANRNKAIAYLLKHFHIIEAHLEKTLDFYFQNCSIEVNSVQLSQMAACLAKKGPSPVTQKTVFAPGDVRDILSLMFTCGMYDSSGEWAFNVGVPAKSGVSGCIFGVVPGKYGIAAYSPKIDSRGHSIRARHFFEELSKESSINLFLL